MFFFIIILAIFANESVARYVDSVIPSPLRDPQWPAKAIGENSTEQMDTMARDLRILTVINLMQQVFNFFKHFLIFQGLATLRRPLVSPF